MNALNELLATFNLHLNRNKDGEIEPLAIQQVLNNIKGKPEEKIISAVALRSMQQARYNAENLGHFGLAAQYYTHFTSPIRRYPDLIVHRLLKEQLSGKMSTARQEKLKARLPEIATHTSKRERIATEAERETILIKEVEYMAQFLGEEFNGIISGVTAFGIFVELDNGVEGLVHVSTMVNDYYEYVESEYALVGEATNFRYRLGDPVTVILTRASIKERAIDLILKDNGKMPLFLEDDIIAKPILTGVEDVDKKFFAKKAVDNDIKEEKPSRRAKKRKHKKEKLTDRVRKDKLSKEKHSKNIAKKKVKSHKFYDEIYNKKSHRKNGSDRRAKDKVSKRKRRK